MVQISVIIPVFNVENYLRQCLDSLVAQTLPDLEIIAVDDGSTDGSSAILAEYAGKDARLKVVTQPNAGAGAARNRGFAEATGDYVIFVDPDDWCEKNMLADMVAAADRTQADMTVCSWREFADDLGLFVETHHFPETLMDRLQPFAAADIANSVFLWFGHAPWNRLWRRAFIKDLGIAFQDLRRSNDFFFVEAATSAAERIAVIDRPYYNYRKNRAGSLQHAVRNNPLIVFEAYAALKTWLESRDMLGRYGSCFRRAALATVRYLIGNLNRRDEFEALVREFRMAWLARLGLDKMPVAAVPEPPLKSVLGLVNGELSVAQYCFEELCRQRNGNDLVTARLAKVRAAGEEAAVKSHKDVVFLKKVNADQGAELVAVRREKERLDQEMGRQIAALNVRLDAEKESAAKALDTIRAMTDKEAEFERQLAARAADVADAKKQLDALVKAHDGKVATLSADIAERQQREVRLWALRDQANAARDKALSDLDQMRRECAGRLVAERAKLEDLKRSRTYRLGRALTWPMRLFAR